MPTIKDQKLALEAKYEQQSKSIERNTLQAARTGAECICKFADGEHQGTTSGHAPECPANAEHLREQREKRRKEMYAKHEWVFKLAEDILGPEVEVYPIWSETFATMAVGVQVGDKLAKFFLETDFTYDAKGEIVKLPQHFSYPSDKQTQARLKEHFEGLRKEWGLDESKDESIEAGGDADRNDGIDESGSVA